MTWETETFTVPEQEKILAGKKKKYIRYEEGITLYSMGKIPLRELAQEAHALIYLKHAAVINTEILDEYIERYHKNKRQIFYIAHFRFSKLKVRFSQRKSKIYTCFMYLQTKFVKAGRNQWLICVV